MKKTLNGKVQKIIICLISFVLIALQVFVNGNNLINNITKIANIGKKATSSVKFTKLIEGYASMFAIDENGNLWAWGANGSGQLGDGTSTFIYTPKLISLSFKLKEISNYGSHTLALDQDGNLWAWGANEAGQLGDGTTTSSLTPKLINNTVGFSKVAAGSNFSIAIDKTGQIWSWGGNKSYQLGNGNSNSVNMPIPISETTQFQDIKAGDTFVIAIDKEKKLWCWGEESSYTVFGDQFSNNTYKTPTKLSDTRTLNSIYALYNKTAIIDTDNNLFLTGQNTNVNSNIYIKEFMQKNNGTKYIDVALGYGHCLAIDENKNLVSWGDNDYGQLGNGTTTNSGATIINVRYGTKFKDVAAFNRSSFALDQDGNIWAWGYNNSGQLGDGTKTNRTTPVQLTVNSEVTVSFDANEGSVSTQNKTVLYGENYGTLPTPTRTNYDFLGWFTAKDEGTQVTENTEVTNISNHTLYAHWKEKEGPEVTDESLKGKISVANYGDKVHYSVTANMVDLNTWSIFYQDDNYMYMIYDTYLPVNTLIPDACGLSYSSSGTPMTGVNGFVTRVNDTKNWVNLVRTDLKDKGVTATGTVSLDMWIDSWNEQGQENGYPKLYYKKDSNGYYTFAITEAANGYAYDFSTTKGVNNKLYFAADKVIAFSNGQSSSRIYLCYNSKISSDSSIYVHLRPVIKIPLSLKGDKVGDTWFIEEDICKIKIDNQDGKEVKESYVVKGEKMPDIQIPVREGYIFQGYFARSKWARKTIL